MPDIATSNSGQYRMSFKNAVISALKQYAVFKGRASRAEYWWFTLFSTLLSSVACTISLQVGDFQELIPAIVQAALIIPGISVGVRRLHDTGRNGWWMLIGFTLIGLIPLWIFFCLRSQPIPNRYGEIPCQAPLKETREATAG